MCDTGTEIDTAPLADTHDDLSQVYQDSNSTQKTILSVVGLSEAEIRSYIAVVEHPHSTVKHLAEDVLDRHRHNISRSLRGLHDTGLVKRREKTFDTGGVGYVYSPIPVEEAERYFQNQLADWMADVCSEIDRLDSRIDLETDSGEILCERVE